MDRASWRLFIAHPLPETVRAQLHEQLAPYRRCHPQVRWTRPETWHLTLVFLGSVDPDYVPDLVRLVNDVARDVAPYQARVAAGDGRMRQGEGVAWLGVSEGAGALIEAAALVADGCRPEITERPPRRTPSAHLTLVRRADAAVIGALREQTHGPLGVSWTVDRLALMRSHLQAAGARYRALHVATL